MWIKISFAIGINYCIQSRNIGVGVGFQGFGARILISVITD